MSASEPVSGAAFFGGDVQVLSRAQEATGGIAIVMHDLRGGGAERACLRLARGMVASGRQVELILVRGEGAYASEIPAGVKVTILDRPRVSRTIGALAAHFRRSRPKAVLSALTHTNLATIAAAHLSGAAPRIVVSERNQMSAKARDARSAWQRAIYRVAPLAYRMVDRVVAVSGGVAEDLSRFARLPDAKLHVIHNPVFDPDIEQMALAPAAHPWFEPSGPPIILAAGRLHRQKGFDTLLRAFAIARAEMDCRLVILGEGGERAALGEQAQHCGLGYDIDMPGFCENPFPLMARAGVFVLSSRWEGFPNALVEAMACGAPVVATDCPSGPREILEDGRLAPLVPVDDAEALARAMLETLARRPDTSASRARAQGFSIAAATAQYLQALEEA